MTPTAPRVGLIRGIDLTRKELLGVNLGALTVQLTPTDLQEINTDFSTITVHGERMDPGNMQRVE